MACIWRHGMTRGHSIKQGHGRTWPAAARRPHNRQTTRRRSAAHACPRCARSPTQRRSIGARSGLAGMRCRRRLTDTCHGNTAVQPVAHTSPSHVCRSHKSPSCGPAMRPCRTCRSMPQSDMPRAFHCCAQLPSYACGSPRFCRKIVRGAWHGRRNCRRRRRPAAAAGSGDMEQRRHAAAAAAGAAAHRLPEHFKHEVRPVAVAEHQHRLGLGGGPKVRLAVGEGRAVGSGGSMRGRAGSTAWRHHEQGLRMLVVRITPQPDVHSQHAERGRAWAAQHAGQQRAVPAAPGRPCSSSRGARRAGPGKTWAPPAGAGGSREAAVHVS